MQRLIQVELRHSDVVLESTDYWLPLAVNSTKRSIAIFNRINDNANGHQVKDLVEVSALLHHLFVQTPQMLTARGELSIDVHSREPGIYLAQRLCQVHVALRGTNRNQVVKLCVSLWEQRSE